MSYIFYGYLKKHAKNTSNYKNLPDASKAASSLFEFQKCGISRPPCTF